MPGELKSRTNLLREGLEKPLHLELIMHRGYLIPKIRPNGKGLEIWAEFTWNIKDLN